MFTIQAEEGGARSGVLKTSHGSIKTPCFKAVATKAGVKMINVEQLKEMGTEAIISNAFILYLRPGLEIIEGHSGLHKFMNWDKCIYTDCGGFQVLSMENDFHLKTSDKGISFRSPFDGTKHMLTPEKTMEIESRLGSDVAMALDHMPLYGCTKQDAILSLKHTHSWMEQCKKIHDDIKAAGNSINNRQMLFGIAQGSVFPDLRKRSIKFIDSLDFDGIAFGGLAVGEPKEDMYKMIKVSAANCSKLKLRHLMGVGSPSDLLRCISMGIDTFDSVFPTRNARHAHLFTKDGPINIMNAKFRDDLTPIDNRCKCRICKNYTRSYLHHLFRTGEKLGQILASYHNLAFIQQMMKDSRKAIAKGEFEEYKNNFLKSYELTGNKRKK